MNPTTPIVLNRPKLASALKVASSLKSDTLPILGGRLLQVREGRLVITATDLDNTLEIGAGPVVDGAWGAKEALVLPGAEMGRAVTAMAGAATAEQVAIFPQKNAARLEAGEARVTVAGWDPAEFPGKPKDETFEVLTIKAVELLVRLEDVAFCASTDETRYVINGVCLETTPEALRLVATDGRRLATVEQPCAGSSGWEPVIVPTSTVKLLARLLKWQAELDESVEVTVRAGKQFLQVVAPMFTLWSKVIEGRFPKWRQVLPETKGEPYHRLALDRDELRQRFDVATCVLSDFDGKAVKLECTGGGVIFSACEPERGEARDVLALKFEEAKWVVALSAALLREALAAVPHETFELCVADEFSPVVLECGTWQHVIMPMRVC